MADIYMNSLVRAARLLGCLSEGGYFHVVSMETTYDSATPLSDTSFDQKNVLSFYQLHAVCKEMVHANLIAQHLRANGKLVGILKRNESKLLTADDKHIK
jgi:hypothetical protein